MREPFIDRIKSRECLINRFFFPTRTLSDQTLPPRPICPKPSSRTNPTAWGNTSLTQSLLSFDNTGNPVQRLDPNIQYKARLLPVLKLDAQTFDSTASLPRILVTNSIARDPIRSRKPATFDFRNEPLRNGFSKLSANGHCQSARRLFLGFKFL